jgi:hypothetical protein
MRPTIVAMLMMRRAAGRPCRARCPVRKYGPRTLTANFWSNAAGSCSIVTADPARVPESAHLRATPEARRFGHSHVLVVDDARWGPPPARCPGPTPRPAHRALEGGGPPGHVTPGGRTTRSYLFHRTPDGYPRAALAGRRVSVLDTQAPHSGNDFSRVVFTEVARRRWWSGDARWPPPASCSPHDSRAAASAACASALTAAKNAADCPMNRPFAVKACAAPEAAPLV